jgi:hypothetical protein
MDQTDLLGASRRELDLYGELAAAYRALKTALGGDDAPADPALVAAHRERAEAVINDLRAVAGTLASHRLSAGTVSPEIEALWRESATLAAEAAETNAELGRLARARQAAVVSQLATLGRGRRALSAYRPGGELRGPALGNA